MYAIRLVFQSVFAAGSGSGQYMLAAATVREIFFDI
jgi:hypothetical protein